MNFEANDCFASGGIGQATARLLAEQGCSIAVHHSSDASKANADALVSELTKSDGVRAAAFQADLSSYEQAKRLHEEVVQRLGHPDIFFGNHGATAKTIGPSGDIQDISPEVFEQTWRLNTGTNYYVRPRLSGDVPVAFTHDTIAYPALYSSHGKPEMGANCSHI